MKPDGQDEPFKIELDPLDPGVPPPVIPLERAAAIDGVGLIPQPTPPRSVDRQPAGPQRPAHTKSEARAVGPVELDLTLPLEAEPPRAVLLEPPTVTQDEEIFCPVCAYNLSGTFSGRCPECGSLFDRNALIAAQQADAVTLIPWDDPSEMPFRVRLYGTLRICLLNAERFAFAFSVRPKRSRADSFFWGVTLVTTILALFATLAFVLVTGFSKDVYTGLPDELAGVCAVAAFVPITLGVTTLLSAAFLWAYCPHYDGQRHFRPWLSIAAYAAAHFLLIFPAIPVCLVLPLLVGRCAGSEFAFVGFFVWLGCAALCVLTMRAVIHLRTSEVDDPRFAVGMLALMHFGAFIICQNTALIIGESLADLVRLF